MPFSPFPAGVPLHKRLFDLLVVIPGLIFALPLMLVIGLVLFISEGRPVLFRQPRGGYQGRVFHVWKFRTMREAYDSEGRPLPDEQRVSALGRFLRAASLDELPELFLVLLGQMSLVGPRPLMSKYLDRYTPEQMRRHDVLPGITGWAQINGRNALSWEQRFALDVWYVDHWSIWLDLKILFLTVEKVIRREGISQPGQVSMQEFLGSRRAD